MKRAVVVGLAAAGVLSTTVLAVPEADADRTVLVVGGQLDGGEGRAVQAAAVAAIESAGWTVVESGPSGEATSALVACMSGDEAERDLCVASLFEGAKVQRAVVVRVASKDYGGEAFRVLTGWVLRPSGKALAFEQRFCARCQPAELERTARSLIAVLIRSARIRATPSLLAVRSTPPGARIVLDDKVVGVTDMDFRVYPGRHIVHLEKHGFAGETREVRIDDGEHAEVDVTLQPTKRTGGRPPTAERVERAEPERASLVVPWLVVGAGSAALAAGGLLLLLDEEGSSGGGLRGRDFHNTTPIGLGVGVAGALAVGAGIYLLVRRPDETTPAPVVSVGGEAAWVGVRGAF